MICSISSINNWKKYFRNTSEPRKKNTSDFPWNPVCLIMVILISWFTKESPNHSTSIILPTQTMHYFILFPGKISKYYHTICCLFHPPKKGFLPNQPGGPWASPPFHHWLQGRITLKDQLLTPSNVVAAKEASNKRSDDRFLNLNTPRSHIHQWIKEWVDVFPIENGDFPVIVILVFRVFHMKKQRRPG